MSSNSSSCQPGTSFLHKLDCGAGAATNNSGETIGTLVAAIVGSLASFGAQLLVFLILRLRLSRIYRPRSYLVPEKERVPVPPKGVVAWLLPLFTTPNLAFIQKCGLDAYFFLRYLRMLLKIFLPMAVFILTILLPVNRYSGDAASGLDRLSISNVAPNRVAHTLWAHLILALCVIVWVCYVAYREMRGYIRVRQAYLTSPQHRIRASATTVLVTGIPRKWLTVEALSGLYDVFPGGIRNIWINRNFDPLADKVKYRDGLAKSLEAAETNLIKKCIDKHEKNEKKKRKQEGQAKKTKAERKQDEEVANAAAERMAQGNGVTEGDQHTTPHGLRGALDEAEAEEDRRRQHDEQQHHNAHSLGLIEDGLGIVGKGLGKFGHGVGNLGQKVVGDVDTGIRKAAVGVDQSVQHANTVSGFVTDDNLYTSPNIGENDPWTPPARSTEVVSETGLNDSENRGSGAILENDQRRQPNNQPHPLAAQGLVAGSRPEDSRDSETTHFPPGIRMTGPSTESSKPPRSPFQIEEPKHLSSAPKKSIWNLFNNNDHLIALPSPKPHTADEDEFPLNAASVQMKDSKEATSQAAGAPSDDRRKNKFAIWRKKEKSTEENSEQEEPEEVYPQAFSSEWDEDQDGGPVWRKYLEPKERETMRLALFSPTWCPSIPLVGKKVDRIYWLRRELSRLNFEIETDQSDVDKFPFMNSAFIQFNHQVAAHMACQSLSHHVPQHMAPRLVEISPDDVLWDNMSVKWWERYVRTLVVLAISIGLIIFYAIPVTFTSLLAKVSVLAQAYHFLAWLNRLPETVISIIQGLLPPILLSVILLLVPIIFRLLVKQQGVSTGNGREIGVQQWYFTFLFIQVFLVVTITGGLTSFFASLSKDPISLVSKLADDLPKGANYFFSYLMVQAFSNSASALLQIFSLLGWFVFAPLFDSTARAKWRRQTTLSNIQWGTFFPPFTNFAVIGIIYSVIAPLILFFMLIIFSLVWIVQRYNILYVYQFRNDTGGLLFPTAVNQLFTGLYVLELCLIGLFFTKEDQNHDVVCIPQGVIMIVAMVATIAYQWTLNDAFKPLFRYLPITLEDEAVIRDEEFARAQASKFAPLASQDSLRNDRDIQDVLEDREEAEEEAEERAEDAEKRQVDEHKRHHRRSSVLKDQYTVNADGEGQGEAVSASPAKSPRSPWHQRSSLSSPGSKPSTWRHNGLREVPNHAASRMRDLARTRLSAGGSDGKAPDARTPGAHQHQDVEAQQTVGDVLFAGFADDLEDLTPEERDVLVRYAFQHSALRAKRPVVWIPRDRLGVSDDEIRRAKRMSTVWVPVLGEEGAEEGKEKGKEKGGVEGGGAEGERVEKTNIWMSNEGTALDGKGKVVFRRSPPDFSNVDLIAL